MKNDKGFSLVSVMVAIVLISIGILSIFSTQVSAYSLQTHANARTAAVNIARAHMEQIKAQDPRTLGAVPLSPERVDSDGQPDEKGAFTRKVDIASGGDHLKQVTVIVDFPKAKQPIELVTLVYHQTF